MTLEPYDNGTSVPGVLSWLPVFQNKLHPCSFTNYTFCFLYSKEKKIEITVPLYMCGNVFFCVILSKKKIANGIPFKKSKSSQFFYNGMKEKNILVKVSVLKSVSKVFKEIHNVFHWKKLYDLRIIKSCFII